MEEKQNPMSGISINKVVINIGVGADDKTQPNAKRLLNLICGKEAADSMSKKRNPAFKITKGQKIGAFVTLRGKGARQTLARLFDAVDNKIRQGSVTNNSASFGIREYIDISGIKYDPKIGMMGMNVNISFMRKGLRVTLRKRQRSSIPERHRIISREEITEYLKKEFNVNAIGEQASA
jgi:large subunit ribosomal protein L5